MKIPLLGKPFEEHTEDSFYDYVKKLAKPYKPKPRVIKTRKKKPDVSTAGFESNSKEN